MWRLMLEAALKQQVAAGAFHTGFVCRRRGMKTSQHSGLARLGRTATLLPPYNVVESWKADAAVSSFSIWRFPRMHQGHGSICLPTAAGDGVSLTQRRAGVESPSNRSICQIQQVTNQNQPTGGVMVPGQRNGVTAAHFSPL